MSDYIKREDALNAFNGAFYPVIAMLIRDIPAADVEPVKRGKWLRMSECSEDVDDRYKCSKCGYVVHRKDIIHLMTYNRWCGHCGSRNDEVGNE